MKHFNTIFVISTWILLSFLQDVQAQPLRLTIRKEDSHVGFSIYKWGVIKEEGRFRDFEGTIDYNPDDPAATSVRMTIRAASIDSRNEGRDRALRSEEFFNVSKHPTLSFESTRVVSHEGNSLRIEGNLTMRGVTRRIVVPVQVLGVSHAGSELGTIAGFESQFTVNREDFRIGEGWAVIGKEATIHLMIGAGSRTVATR